MDHIGELRKALYVYSMNANKSRTKPLTRARLENQIIEACRAIVRDVDGAPWWEIGQV